MPETRYLSVEEAIRYHDRIMERTGSPPCPLLFPDRLDSALKRPSNAAYFGGADLLRQASLLAIGISQAQAFEDGNKRAAFVVTDLFLRANGMVFQGDPLEMSRHLERIAESLNSTLRGVVSDAFETWLRSRTFPGDGASVVPGE